MEELTMSDREKLIELLMDMPYGRGTEEEETTHIESVADYLIANGWTIQKEGVWVGEADGYADGELVYDVWYCAECNYCIDDGTDDYSLLPNYCPNCGATMLPEAPKGE